MVDPSSGDVKVSTIDLANTKTSFDVILPKFDSPTSIYGRFIPSNPSNYLVAGDGTWVITGDKKSKFQLPTQSAFVLTSDTT